MPLKIELFKNLIRDTLDLSGNIDNENNMRIVKSVFGCTIAIIATIWYKLMCQALKPDKGKPLHLLFALALLKTYETEDNYSIKFAVTRVTFRKWAWEFIEAISDLKVVSVSMTMTMTMIIFDCCLIC